MSEVPDRMVIAGMGSARRRDGPTRTAVFLRKVCAYRERGDLPGEFWTLGSIVPDVCAHYYHCCLRKGVCFHNDPSTARGHLRAFRSRGSSLYSFVCPVLTRLSERADCAV